MSKRPTIHRDICGTIPGYQKHTKRGDQHCQACIHAWNVRAPQRSPHNRPNANEIADEIRWMLRLNQGHHYILNAIGYTGRTQALEKRMRDNGEPDLAKWAADIYKLEAKAA